MGNKLLLTGKGEHGQNYEGNHRLSNLTQKQKLKTQDQSWRTHQVQHWTHQALWGEESGSLNSEKEKEVQNNKKVWGK